jgi:hypothetical protein
MASRIMFSFVNIMIRNKKMSDDMRHWMSPKIRRPPWTLNRMVLESGILSVSVPESSRRVTPAARLEEDAGTMKCQAKPTPGGTIHPVTRNLALQMRQS